MLNDAKNKSKNFLVQDQLLYHRDKVLGETIYQLVVLEVCRKQLLELMHSSSWNRHLRKKKYCSET